MGDWSDLLPRPGQGSGIPEAILAQQQGRAQIGAQNAQAQVLGAQFQELQKKAATEQQYQYDVAQYLKNPTPEATMAMFDKYPDQAKALSQGYAVKDEAARRSDVGYFGSLYSALDNKNVPLAVSSLKQRRDADKAAGLDTTLDDEWVAAAEKGDETALATIKGSVLAHLAAAAGRDKFAENFGAVGGSKMLKSASAGDWVYDQDGNIRFKVPQADQYKNVAPGDSLVKIPGEGGGPSPGGGGNPYDVVLGNGTYGTPPAPLTSMTLGEVYDFGRKTLIPNSKAAGVGKDSRGTIGSSAVGAYQITGETMKRIAPAVLGPDWQSKKFTPEVQDKLGEAIYTDALKRGTPLNQVWASLSPTVAKNLAGKPWSLVSQAISKSEIGSGVAPSGGATVVATGAAKPGYRPATPAEVTLYGLDPDVAYQVSPEGKVEPVGGQKGAASGALKAWPAKTLDARITNDASVENIDTAIKLLDPKNNSAEAKAARGGVGIGTGALGEQYTNWNNPEGTPIRALIGQIGGIIIKDISGAAVSVAEDARLSKWVPKVTDSPSVITYKIQNLKREIALRNSVMDRVGKSQGYRPFTEEKAATSGAPSPSAGGGWGKAVRVK